jgi:AAA+ superfamily predicted ATPase
MLEQDQSHSLVLAATNHPDILDPALRRRFDDVLHYRLPDSEQIVTLLRNRLTGHLPKETSWNELSQKADALSHAEIAKAAEDALKEALIEGDGKMRADRVIAMLNERHEMRGAWKQVQAKS